MDALVIKSNANTYNSTDNAPEQSRKDGPSKFDNVREAAMSRDRSATASATDPVQASSGEQAPVARESQYLALADSAKSRVEPFTHDLKTARGSLDQLTKRVSAIPDHPSLQPLRKQLAELETQYSKAGQAVNAMNGTATPQQLLKMQDEMYQINERLSIMSKLVDQVSGGVKSILQTQI